MAQDNNISFIPIAEYRYPKEGKRAVQYNVDLSAAPFSAVVDLVNVCMRGQISQIPTLYYDNADNAFAVTIVMEGTLQRILCPANTQGYVRLLLPQKPRLGFSAPQACQFKVSFLNWAVEEVFIWGASAVSGVTSVGLALPAEFNVTGSPVTGTGTLTGAWANETANKVLAGPASGGAATPNFRALAVADLPITNTEIKSVVPFASGVAMVTTVSANITSISLPPGAWEVMASIAMFPNAANMTSYTAAISQISGTLPNPTTDAGGCVELSCPFNNASTISSITPVRIVNAGPGNLTVYLVLQANFSAGVVTGWGTLRAVKAII